MSQEHVDQMISRFIDFVVEYVPRLTITLALFILVFYLAKAALLRLEKQMSETLESKHDISGESAKRIRTLFSIFRKATNLIILVIAVLVILNIFHVDIGPILAAAGVVGLAVSFGAQSLVKDIIAGVFILFENQIRVGDVAVINGKSGLVEEINLRTVILRDATGTVHVWPNGNINELSNVTKDWSAAIIDVGVDYRTNLGKVYTIMKDVALHMREDSEWGNKIIADVEVFGLENFGESSLDIKARIKTKPSEQWSVGREYRKRLKEAFDENGISIPFPTRTMVVDRAPQEEPKPITQVAREQAADPLKGTDS